eukprot:PhF_6_TR40475/c0_g1_i1/m.60511
MHTTFFLGRMSHCTVSQSAFTVHIVSTRPDGIGRNGKCVGRCSDCRRWNIWWISLVPLCSCAEVLTHILSHKRVRIRKRFYQPKLVCLSGKPVPRAGFMAAYTKRHPCKRILCKVQRRSPSHLHLLR